MGLNPPSTSPPPDDAWLHATLPAYALDAVDGDEALVIDAWLASVPGAATLELALRYAAGELAAAADPALDVEPPAELRDRVIAAGHARRAPVDVDPSSAVDVHRVELDRFEMLLHRLSPEQWQAGVAPPEFAGWTVHDLAAHVAANEGLLAQLLDLSVPSHPIPETANDNVERTNAVLERHRAMTPGDTSAELHALVAAVDDHIRSLDTEALERDIVWWGSDMRIGTVLLVRSFETWTHADDIRRSLGLDSLAPPAASLRAMSEAAAGWTPLMVMASGFEHPDRSVELRLTGPGGRSYHVGLDLDERDVTGLAPDATITVDVVDYCRAVGNRFVGGSLPYVAEGDLDLARDVVASLSALATL